MPSWNTEHSLPYWLPNSEATKRKPVFSTHMAAATGTVSKYLSRISVTWNHHKGVIVRIGWDWLSWAIQILSLSHRSKRIAGTYHVLISLQCDFEDITLLRLSQEKEHGLCLVCGRADKDHASLRVIQVILLQGTQYQTPWNKRQPNWIIAPSGLLLPLQHSCIHFWCVILPSEVPNTCIIYHPLPVFLVKSSLLLRSPNTFSNMTLFISHFSKAFQLTHLWH